MTREPDHSPIESMCRCAPLLALFSRRGLQTAESIGLRVRGNQASLSGVADPFSSRTPVMTAADTNPSMRDNEKVIGVARGDPVHQGRSSKLPLLICNRSGQSNSFIYFTYNPRRIKVLESEAHLVGLSRAGQNHARLPPTQLCQHSTNIFQKKYCLVDLLSLVRR
jgi:hypothetical protein